MNTSTNNPLPYGRQLVEDDDVAAVCAVLRGDFLTTGPAVPAFEEAFANEVGAGHAVACSSGTTGLHLAVLAAGLEQGDTAIVPAMSFIASANCVRHAGGEVIFADADPETGLITPATLEAAIEGAGGRAKAVIVVHLNGQACAMAEIAGLAQGSGLSVIEDACHAVGSGYEADGKTARVGACAHSALAVFSFHPVKTIASGEGGMVTTNDPALARRMSELRHHGLVRDAERFADAGPGFDSAGAPNPWYAEASELGFNYRMSDIHAALGLSQLAKLERFARARQALVERYDGHLAGWAPTLRPVARVPGGRPVWHLYAVHIDFTELGLERAAVMRALAERGIGTQVHYLPIHQQPYYRERYGAQDFPGAQAYYRSILSLPLFASMTAGDVDRVVEALASVLGL
ncbi:MAG: UDP-4-amino-4,6-dideoxy-N-acetyl-beta-L-altrosamine transaminase [Alphaproteobacteria bacterium]